MKKKISNFILLMCLSTGILFADVTRWEYLIVCFGNTYFSDEGKALIYFSSDDAPSEGNNLRTGLDTLGKHGWEVIDIVGTIGGDQEIVLKRKYDQAVTDQENSELANILAERTASIEKEYALYLATIKLEAEKEKAREEELSKAIEEKITLINRDELDELEINRIRNERLAQKVSEEIEKDKSMVLGVFEGYSFPGLEKKQVETEFGYEFELQFDITDTHLQNTNQYRKSEVELFLRKRADELTTRMGSLLQLHIKYRLSALIQYNGESIEVANRVESYAPPNPDI